MAKHSTLFMWILLASLGCNHDSIDSSDLSLRRFLEAGDLRSGERYREARGTVTAFATSNVVTDVPAVDRTHYPDSIGYLYHSDLASVFWLQNHPEIATLEDLQNHLARDMNRGLSGEILSSAMQRVDPTASTQPTLPEMAKRSAQSVKLLVQYESLAHDYAQSLADDLNAYNTDPVRQQGIIDTVDQVEALFAANPTVPPPGRPPAPPPPDQSVIRPSQYFAEAVIVHERANLAKRARDLQRAIDSRDALLYDDAFVEVYSMQRNVDVAKDAVVALGAHHEDGVLKGQPLDIVVSTYVLRPHDADNPFSTELLSLINRVNLISNNMSVSRQALVAALLLIDEDHQQRHVDPTLSFSSIWDNVNDESWLVSQYVRIKGNGTTIDQVNTIIQEIVTNI